MKNNGYITIDKKAANNFIHDMNHLSFRLVPKEILEMEITLTTGKRSTIGGLIEQAQKRTHKLGDYIKLAMQATEEA